MRLSLTVLLVWIVIASLRESFIRQIAFVVVGVVFLMFIFGNAFLELVLLFYIFQPSSMGLELGLDILKSHIVEGRLYMHHSLLTVFLLCQVIIFVQVYVIVIHCLFELLSALVFHLIEC